jgi:hypothetical protein
MAEKSQPYTLTHTASVLGDEYVSTSSNQTQPQRPDTIISFECPKSFEEIEYVGRRDPTRFVPRTLETFSGDGAKTTFDLTADIQPIAGETAPDDQDYPAVVGYDTDAGAELSVASYDYAANSVSFESAPNNAADNVKLYPIINEGNVQFRGVNQFGQTEGHVDNWGTPIYRWHDFEQLREGREVNLDGAMSWGRYEKLEVMVDSPRVVVGPDDDYPRGEYVTTFEQDVIIHLE